MKRFPVGALLLFDLDGTLIDSAQDIANAANDALAKLGLPPRSCKEVSSFIGDGVARLVERLVYGHEKTRAPNTLINEALSRKALKLLREHYARNLLTYTKPYPGVEETLERLCAYPKAVLTNKPHDMTAEIIRRLEWGNYFGFVLGGDRARRKKPDPSAVHDALAHFKKNAKEALFVGDSLMDIEAARAAGVSTCAVLYGYGTREALGAAQPEYKIERFEELLEILNSEL